MARILPVFERFIADVRGVWASEPDAERRMAKARPLLEKLVLDPALRLHSKGWPSTEPRGNLLLHEDHDYDFVVNAVVRTPNRKGGVHDHAHAWVLYALLDGFESLERYKRLDGGATPGHAEVRLSSITSGGPGKVDLVPPFGIHAEQGGPERSVAVILRSERLVGRTLQHGYDVAAQTVVERWGPEQIPFALEQSL